MTHRVLHDVTCPACGNDSLDESFSQAEIERGDWGVCEQCGTLRKWLPNRFATDVFGQPQYSEASGQFHSSTREKVRHMRALGYEEAGDRVHGGRNDGSLRKEVPKFKRVPITRRSVAVGDS